MAAGWWHWLWFSGGGLAVRIGAGVGILAAFLIVDLAGKGTKSRRLREYAFLVAATAGAMGYALANDMVTVTISPEYFMAHEGLADNAVNVRAVAAVVGLRGAWWAGLILGALLLFANSAPRRWPALSFRRLYARLLYVGLAAAAGAVICAAGASSGSFDGLLDISGPPGMRRFMIVYYAHTGAYAGGALGGLAAIATALVSRRRMAAAGAGSGSRGPAAIGV